MTNTTCCTANRLCWMMLLTNILTTWKVDDKFHDFRGFSKTSGSVGTCAYVTGPAVSKLLRLRSPQSQRYSKHTSTTLYVYFTASTLTEHNQCVSKHSTRYRISTIQILWLTPSNREMLWLPLLLIYSTAWTEETSAYHQSLQIRFNAMCAKYTQQSSTTDCWTNVT